MLKKKAHVLKETPNVAAVSVNCAITVFVWGFLFLFSDKKVQSTWFSHQSTQSKNECLAMPTGATLLEETC
jgi:hypothetical protein